MLCLTQVVTSAPVDDIPCPYDGCTCSTVDASISISNIQCNKDSMINGAFPKLKAGQFTQNMLTIENAGSPTINAEDLLPSLQYMKWVNPSSPNPLTAIPPAVFTLTNLTKFSVAYNNITSIDNIIFPSSCNLIMIDLSNNPLTNIAPGVFQNQENLKALFLSNTRLTRLPLALADLTSVEYIRLDNIPDLQCTCEESSLGTWYEHRINRHYGIHIDGDCDVTSVENVASWCDYVQNKLNDTCLFSVENFLAQVEEELCPAPEGGDEQGEEGEYEQGEEGEYEQGEEGEYEQGEEGEYEQGEEGEYEQGPEYEDEQGPESGDELAPQGGDQASQG